MNQKTVLAISWISLVICFGLLLLSSKWAPLNTNSPTSNNTTLSKEQQLKVVIDDKNHIEKNDIYNAIGRLTDLQTFSYEFDAILDPNGNGYIWIVKWIESPSWNLTGEAMFLVPPKALNQTQQGDLEKSIQAINGLAINFNKNIEFAGKWYDYNNIIKLFK